MPLPPEVGKAYDAGYLLGLDNALKLAESLPPENLVWALKALKTNYLAVVAEQDK